MQTVRVESEHIKLPRDVFSKLKGKEIRFVEFSDGFLLSLFSLNYLPLPNWQI